MDDPAHPVLFSETRAAALFREGVFTRGELKKSYETAVVPFEYGWMRRWPYWSVNGKEAKPPIGQVMRNYYGYPRSKSLNDRIDAAHLADVVSAVGLNEFDGERIRTWGERPLSRLVRYEDVATILSNHERLQYLEQKGLRMAWRDLIKAKQARISALRKH